MNKIITLIFILCISLIGLVGCNFVKSEYDYEGTISKIDIEGNRILLDDYDTGLIWIILKDNGDIKEYRENQEVGVWVGDLILTSEPPQAYAVMKYTPFILIVGGIVLFIFVSLLIFIVEKKVRSKKYYLS
jgi:hypothetical protein